MVSWRGVLYRILYDAVLSRLPEPTAIALGQTALRLLPFDRLPAFRLDDSRLAVTLGGARLPNPVILAAMYYDSRILERAMRLGFGAVTTKTITRSEEHTSELQSHSDLVCRLLLKKKNTPTRSGRAP